MVINDEKYECNKVSYSTKKFAMDDLNRISLRSTRLKKPINVYFCDKCKTWHLTSQEIYKDIIVQLRKEKEKLLADNMVLQQANEQRQNVINGYKEKEKQVQSLADREQAKQKKTDKIYQDQLTKIKALELIVGRLRTDNKKLIYENLIFKENQTSQQTLTQSPIKPLKIHVIGDNPNGTMPKIVYTDIMNFKPKKIKISFINRLKLLLMGKVEVSGKIYLLNEDFENPIYHEPIIKI